MEFKREPELVTLMAVILLTGCWSYGGEEEAYRYNYGACVSACINRGKKESLCNDRCWKIWGVFLKKSYLTTNRAVKKTDNFYPSEKNSQKERIIKQKDGVKTTGEITQLRTIENKTSFQRVTFPGN